MTKAKRPGRRPTTVPLDEYDPLPSRNAVHYLGVLAIVSIVAVVILKLAGQDVEGVLAIPASVITALVMQLSRRPPWTVRDGRGKDA